MLLMQVYFVLKDVYATKDSIHLVLHNEIKVARDSHNIR